jgi:tetratricopeptide (TPR) repeat protein
MKPADEHNTQDAILSLFDGALAPAEADRVRVQIDDDPIAKEEAAVWDTLFEDLHAIGDGIGASAPSVELWLGIEGRLDTSVDDQDEAETWTFDQLLDLAEGRLEPQVAATLRDQIEQSSELKQNYAWITSMREDLGQHGAAITASTPTVDLLPAIMKAVTSADDESEDLFASLLEWRDGQLPLPDSDRLRRMAGESESVRSANSWVTDTAEDLESLGDRIVANVPDIDVSDAVMDAVHRISEPDTVVSFDAERLRRRARWRATGSVAAVAMIAVTIGANWFSTNDPEQIVAPPEEIVLADPEPTWQQDDYIEKRQQLPTRFKRRMIAQQPLPEVVPPETLAETQTPELDALSPDAVIEAGRKAAKTRDWTEFQQLASLTPEEAKALAEEEGLPPSALVGVADSLMPDYAEKALLTVVGSLPDSPYVQLRLLESVAYQPLGEAQSEEPLAFSQKISELDPENALPYYLEAKMYLDNGDPRSAIAVLLEAQALEYASPYSLEAAAHRQSALIANGLEPETAELLAAFNAGNEEADALYNLAVDLLDYGSEYNAIGDFDTAQLIFQGVQTLGDQIEAGAVLSQEQLVALDIQSAAIDVLGQFYEAQGIVEALGPLTEQSLNIIGDLDSLSGLLVQINTMLGDVLDPTFWNDVAGVFLTEGDLAILGYLEDWGILTESL